MTKEDKELLLKDLCARLPYGVIVADFDENGHRMSVPAPMTNMANEECYYVSLKPYLRPMSNMTSEEWCEYCDASLEDEKSWVMAGENMNYKFTPIYNKEIFLNAHHFDYKIDKNRKRFGFKST